MREKVVEKWRNKKICMLVTFRQWKKVNLDVNEFYLIKRITLRCYLALILPKKVECGWEIFCFSLILCFGSIYGYFKLRNRFIEIIKVIFIVFFIYIKVGWRLFFRSKISRSNFLAILGGWILGKQVMHQLLYFLCKNRNYRWYDNMLSNKIKIPSVHLVFFLLRQACKFHLFDLGAWPFSMIFFHILF
jgi:hypothetical protein